MPPSRPKVSRRLAGGLSARRLRRRHKGRWPAPQTYVPGNLLTLYTEGGACYDAMIEAIDGAETCVHMETYLLRADAVGWRFAEALAAAAARGVEVAFMYDAVGALGVGEAFERFLDEAGVGRQVYHPLLNWRWDRITRRNHRKILAVDGATAFVGGMSIAALHAPVAEGGEGWRDTHLRVRGPAALSLDRLFREEWVAQGGAPLLAPEAPQPVALGSAVRVMENRRWAGRGFIRRAYMEALAHAQERVWITNSYFLPDRRFLRALRRAAARGVDVRVILAGVSDVPAIRHAAVHLYGRLLKAGVRVFEWTESVLHAKTAVVDQRWSTIGTYNLDRRSLSANLEVNAMVLDAGLASELAQVFEADQGRCEEQTLDQWRRRGLFERARSWFWWLFRAWL